MWSVLRAEACPFSWLPAADACSRPLPIPPSYYPLPSPPVAEFMDMDYSQPTSMADLQEKVEKVESIFCKPET